MIKTSKNRISKKFKTEKVSLHHNNVEYDETYKNYCIMKEEKIDKIIISLTDVKKKDCITHMAPI